MKRPRRLLFIGSDSHYGSGVAEGIYRYCQAHGNWEYHLERDSSEPSLRRSRTAIRQWRPDGIIACVQSQRIADLLVQSKIPAVSVTASYGIHTSVWSDFHQIGRLIADHFLANGLKRFGFCLMTREPQAVMKCKGFVEALVPRGHNALVHDDDDFWPPSDNWLDSHRRLSQWLKTLPTPIGIMCTYDFLARDIAVAAQRLGLRVPDDIAIVGVSNEESVCRMCQPPLSSVELPRFAIGYEAARLLDGLIRGKKPPAKPLLIPVTKLVVRQSSNIIAVEDPDIAAVVRYIRQHACEPISIKDVLLNVPISRRVMEQRFSRLIGRTPKSEIIRHRIERASSLLVETELPIPDVAQRSGFSGPETFAITFHRKIGMSPTAFRHKSRLAGHSAVPSS